MEIPSCPRCLTIQINKENKWGEHYCRCCGFRDLSPAFYKGLEREAVQELFMRGILEGRGYCRKQESTEEKRERRKEYGIDYYKTHKEERSKYAKIYYRSEKGKITSQKAGHQRRAALLSCQINDLSKEQIKVLFNNTFRCVICNKKFTKKRRIKSIDHIVPLSKAGNNTLLNIQVICRRCNSIKRDRDYTLFNNGQLLLFV